MQSTLETRMNADKNYLRSSAFIGGSILFPWRSWRFKLEARKESERLTQQLRIERDLGAGEHFGDGAVLFRGLGDFLELGVVEAGDFDGGLQLDRGNAEAFAFFDEADFGGRFDLLRRVARFGEQRR